MRLLILPSWCPTIDDPLSGTFFVEQANAIAKLRPDWNVGLIHFDLARSRIPLRPLRIPRFFRDLFIKPRLFYSKSSSGLHEYFVWSPYLPRYGYESRWSCKVTALAAQAEMALKMYSNQFGKPSLIHAHSVYPGGAAAVLLSHKYKIPIGVTEHVGPFPPPAMLSPDGDLLPLIKSTFSSFLHCSSVSQHLADNILSLGLATKVSVLPNYLSNTFGSCLNTKSHPIDKFTFLSVGGPSYAKGTDVLLEAMSHLESNITINIVGNSPDLPYFRRLATSLGLNDRVSWLGSVPRSKMPEMYLQCDAFVLPSRYETFGVSLIEALACGRPIISTCCGGPQEIVHDGVGLLVPVDCASKLADAMLMMVKSIGSFPPSTIRSDFLARFSALTAVDRLESWYLEIMSAIA